MSATTSSKKKFVSGIITANDLLAGDVVYLADNGSWSREFSDAIVFWEFDSAHSALERAELQTDKIVGAYIADVDMNGDNFLPSHFRESFRATGPSNYFHGKQAS